MLIAAAIATLASSQSVPAFDGPFVYDAGPSLFIAASYARDLDGDGRDDVLVKPLYPPVLRYRLANVNGSLGPIYEIGQQSTVLVPADAGDGTPELFGVSGTPCPTSSINGFLNSGRTCAQGGAGLGLSPFTIPIPCSSSDYIRSISFSGATMVAAISSSITPVVLYQGAFHLPAVPGAPPTLTQFGAPYVPMTLPPAVSIAIFMVPCGDLDGDGSNDVILRGGSTFEVVRVTASGPVLNTPTSFLTFTGNAPGIVYSADLNGDGFAELIFPDPSNGSSSIVYRNQGPVSGGNGGVLLVPQPLNTIGMGALSFADVDTDGDVDVVGLDGSYQIRFLLNDGLGGLSPSAVSLPGDYSATPLPGDFDGDGDPDLATVSTTIRVFLNRSFGPFVARPGTSDGLSLASGIHGPGVPPAHPTGAPFFDVKRATSRADIDLFLAAPGFAGSTAAIVAEVFPTGCPPPFVAPQLYASGGAGTAILASFTVPPSTAGQLRLTLPSMPAAPQNLSAILQLVVPGAGAANGFFATSEAHEFQL
jgi:hypothetical protein